MASKYVIEKAKNGGFKFNLVAANGEIIATSQVYTTKTACKKGIACVQNIAECDVEDQTVEGYEELKKPKFELYQDNRQEYRFRLISRNGKNIVWGEGYTTIAACKNGIKSIKKNAGSEIVDKSREE
ncbi:MAG TPA: hypothetical protein DDW78_04530 [Treponema sp.]|nr:hypothetical protein [Treponema sp.]